MIVCFRCATTVLERPWTPGVSQCWCGRLRIRKSLDGCSLAFYLDAEVHGLSAWLPSDGTPSDFWCRETWSSEFGELDPDTIRRVLEESSDEHCLIRKVVNS